MGADKSLKHLGFVQTYATVYAGVAEKMYKTAKSYTPKFVEPYVAKAEDVVVARAAPLMTSAQDTTGKLLSFADAKVDTVVAVTAPTIEGYKAFLTSTLASAKSLHDGNMAHFTKAKETYFEMVEKFADWASATLSPTKAYHASVDTLKATVAAAKSMADPKKAIDSVHAAYTSVASLPAVAAALATGTTTLTKVHDTVVAAPLYKAVVDTGAKTLSYATSTSAFKVSQDRLYPLVAPYAAPAVSAATPYLQSMMTYWAPVATA